MAILLSFPSLSPFRTTAVRPLYKTRPKPPLIAAHATNAGRELRLPYQLQEGQTRVFHRLPSGMSMEAIVQKGDCKGVVASSHGEEKPPLVFVHGSFHAAWCWAEHWLPYFSRSGYDCYAISLLGQGESDVPEAKVAGTLQTHTSDVAEFIREEVKSPPVLIGHSFGGLIVQSYLANVGSGSSFHQTSSFVGSSPCPKLAGAVLICSVPPSGNSGLVLRYLLRKPIAAIKVTLSLAAKAFANSLSLCKETFFSSEMEDHLVKQYQELMKGSSNLPLFDLKKLNASLPVTSIPRKSLELLVLGAEDDFIVDMEGLKETAEFYGVDPICLEGVAHDMMLDPAWDKGAELILSWLRSLSRQVVL